MDAACKNNFETQLSAPGPLAARAATVTVLIPIFPNAIRNSLFSNRQKQIRNLGTPLYENEAISDPDPTFVGFPFYTLVLRPKKLDP